MKEVSDKLILVVFFMTLVVIVAGAFLVFTSPDETKIGTGFVSQDYSMPVGQVFLEVIDDEGVDSFEGG